MKKLFFISVILLLGECSFSQQYLNKTFVISYGNQIQTILPTDSGYILGLAGGMGVCMVDSQANIKWLKEYFDPTGTWGSTTGMIPNALIYTNNNTYISRGIMQNGGPSANKNFAVKYSNTFDTLYLKLLLQDTVTLNNYVLGSFINTNSDNYIFLGHSGDSAMIIRTDTNSNFIDSTLILKGNDISWLNSGIQMGNYYYLFGATRSYAPAYVTNSFDRTDGWVVKTDLQGNEITSVAFGNPNLYDQDFKYTLKIFGNKLLTGHFYSYEKNSEGFLMEKPWILILDSNLVINKEIYFKDAVVSGDTLFSMGNTQAIIKNDSSICILGAKSAYNMNLHEILWVKAMITKLDKNFKVKFYRDYIHNASSFININPQTITTTSDGGYLIGGYITDYALTPSIQSWLVKTDSLGCDGLHSCNDTAMVVEILDIPDTICTNTPNWINVRIKGRSAPYRLYANSTLALDSVYYPYTLPLWIDTIMPFVPTDTGWQQLVVTLHEPWECVASDTVQVYVDCVTGFTSTTYQKQKVEILPNPATSELHVKIRGVVEGAYTITMYNTQGKTVEIVSTKESETVIDISKYPQGAYWVRVLGNNIVRSEKVIILKND